MAAHTSRVDRADRLQVLEGLHPGDLRWNFRQLVVVKIPNNNADVAKTWVCHGSHAFLAHFLACPRTAECDHDVQLRLQLTTRATG